MLARNDRLPSVLICSGYLSVGPGPMVMVVASSVMRLVGPLSFLWFQDGRPNGCLFGFWSRQEPLISPF